MTDRHESLKMMYRSIAHRAPYEEEVFINALHNWDVIPIIADETIIGGVLAKENELHVGLGIPIKASGRRYIRKILNETIDKYGFAITTVQPQNSGGLRFCERLGFVRIGEKGGNILLRCDRSNY